MPATCSGSSISFFTEKASIEGWMIVTFSFGRPSHTNASRENTKASASMTYSRRNSHASRAS